MPASQFPSGVAFSFAAVLPRAALAAGSGAAAQSNNATLIPSWTRTLGAPVVTTGYGMPSKYEATVQRRQSPGLTPQPQASISFTPLQNLFGIITPAGVHFERHHSGMPEVDPGAAPADDPRARSSVR